MEGTGSYWAQVTGRVENYRWGRRGSPVMFTMGLELFLVSTLAAVPASSGRALRVGELSPVVHSKSA